MTTLKEELASLETDEQVYGYIKAFLLHQNEKSEMVAIGCAYRGDNNRKCAIGCLILDEFYDQEFEGGLPPAHENYKVTQKGSMIVNAITKSLPNWKINYDLLVNVQQIHDSYEVYSWQYEFNRREEKYNWFTYHYYKNKENI